MGSADIMSGYSPEPDLQIINPKAVLLSKSEVGTDPKAGVQNLEPLGTVKNQAFKSMNQR